MKKLFILGVACFLLLTCTAVAQNNYVAASVSLSNQEENSLSESSYFALEAGVLKENYSYGLAVGRGSFANFENDQIENYWAELKTNVSIVSSRNVDVFLLFGLGSYFELESFFIEYGVGSSYKIENNLNFVVQASNWDTVWYVSPGLSYSF